MKKEEIRFELDKICESRITKLDFDILSNSIILTLEFADNLDNRIKMLKFENVSSYYFANNIKEKRKDFIHFEKGDYLEITTIDIIDGYVTIKDRKSVV